MVTFEDYQYTVLAAKKYFNAATGRDGLVAAIENEMVGLLDGSQQDDSLHAKLVQMLKIANAGHAIYKAHPDMPPREIFNAARMSLWPIRLIATGDRDGFTAVSPEFDEELEQLREMDETYAQASGRWGYR